MKQTLHQIEAFEIAKDQIPNLQMKIAGSTEGTSYGQKVIDRIQSSKYSQDIEYLGKVSYEKKVELMQKSHLMTVTSIKEGWGLIVTEAASQGTPAVVYNIDGLRDSVKNNKTGIITDSNPFALAAGIYKLLNDKKLYDTCRRNSWGWSKSITFDKSFKDFSLATGIA